MNRVRLAMARPRDARAMGRILSGWVDETPWLPRVRTRAEEQGAARVLVQRGHAMVARRFGRVVGFIARDGEEVQALYLSPRARRRGIGKALLDRAKAESPVLTLYVYENDRAARAFYRREGFAELDPAPGKGNDEGLPEVRLRWERESDG